MGDTQPDPDAPIPLIEETVSISKRQVETGRVRVGLHTESNEVEVHTSLLDQHVDVTRVPIGREVTEIPPVREEGDVTIYPVLEEVAVVEKRLVLKEEVHVRRIRSETEFSQPVTLRRQRAGIERVPSTKE